MERSEVQLSDANASKTDTPPPASTRVRIGSAFVLVVRHFPVVATAHARDRPINERAHEGPLR